MTDRRPAIEPVAAPIAAGLVVLVTLLGLIGTAIRDPRPHDIPVGVAGPAPAAGQITGAFNSKAPGAFQFTTYGAEEHARSAVEARDIDAVLVLGAQPKLIVAGAAGDAITGLTTAIFSQAFAAQGTQLAVEVTHPFASGDPHGLVLFFLVLATIVSTFVVHAILLVRGRAARLSTWLGVEGGWAVVAGLAGGGIAAWIVGGYDISGAAAMAGLVAPPGPDGGRDAGSGSLTSSDAKNRPPAGAGRHAGEDPGRRPLSFRPGGLRRHHDSWHRRGRGRRPGSGPPLLRVQGGRVPRRGRVPGRSRRIRPAPARAGDRRPGGAAGHLLPRDVGFTLRRLVAGAHPVRREQRAGGGPDARVRHPRGARPARRGDQARPSAAAGRPGGDAAGRAGPAALRGPRRVVGVGIPRGGRP